MTFFMTVVGLLGAGLLTYSYFLNGWELFVTQLSATVHLLAYSIWRVDEVFIIIQVACILIMTVRLSRGIS